MFGGDDEDPFSPQHQQQQQQHHHRQGSSSSRSPSSGSSASGQHHQHQHPSQIDVGDLHPSLLARYSAHGGDDEDEDDDDNFELLLLDPEDIATTAQSMLHASTMIPLQEHRDHYDEDDEVMCNNVHNLHNHNGDGDDDADAAMINRMLNEDLDDETNRANHHHHHHHHHHNNNSNNRSNAPRRRRRAPDAKRLTWKVDHHRAGVGLSSNHLFDDDYEVQEQVHPVHGSYWARPGIPLDDFREMQRAEEEARAQQHRELMRMQQQLNNDAIPSWISQRTRGGMIEGAAGAVADNSFGSSRGVTLVTGAHGFPVHNGLRLAFEPRVWLTAAAASSKTTTSTTTAMNEAAIAAGVPSFFFEAKPSCGLAEKLAARKLGGHALEFVVCVPQQQNAAAASTEVKNNNGDEAQQQQPQVPKPPARIVLNAGGVVRAAPKGFFALKIPVQRQQAAVAAGAGVPQPSSVAAVTAAVPAKLPLQKPRN